MNFDLGPDEIALRDGIRELCAGRFPMSKVREGFDRAAWKELADAGVFSLRLPESEGGVGLGMTEAVIVFQELGRALVGGPLVASHVAAGLFDGAATGDAVVTFHSDLVEFGAEADVAVELGDGVVTFRDVEGRSVPPLDPLTPVIRLERASEGNSVPTDVHRFAQEAATLTAAFSAGIASRTTELAVDFAKQRQQFDKPIGSFQAVKHMCADMFVRAEIARVAVDAAGVLLDDPEADAGDAVHSAMLLANEYAVANSKTCIQVHGGMGFTWEVDAHLYLKRAAVLAASFGGIDAQAEMVAAAL